MQPSTVTREKLDNWPETLDLIPKEEGWTIEFTLSCVPMEHWFYKRNQLKPEDVKISLITPQWGAWIVQLDRHDGLYQIQWHSPDSRISIKSQPLKYRKIIKWPTLNGLNDFPNLIHELESILEIKFIRHMNIACRSIKTKKAFEKNSQLRQWLKPCADTLGKNMQSQPTEHKVTEK